MVARPGSETSLVQLIEAALRENRGLIEFEFGLARLEAQRQVKVAARAAIGYVTAVIFLLVSLSVLAVAVVLALGVTSTIALVAAAVLIAVGAAAGAFGASLLSQPRPNTPSIPR